MALKTRRLRRKLASRLTDVPEPSAQDMELCLQRMELYDSLNEEERALVADYGLAQAYAAIRQFYGRPAEARKFLESQRRALQVSRWKNIKL